MNTIHLGNMVTQTDISKYVKDTVEIEPQQETKVSAEINSDVPARGTKQYDELKAALTNAKIPVTDDNIKTANLMIKSGIEVHKENIEAAADIKGQLEYIINHANEDSIKSVINNKMSLDKITMNILESVIRDVNENKTQSNLSKSVSKEEINKATEKYIKQNNIEQEEDLDNISKCIENLLQQGLPITNKNVQALESVISKSEEIKSADKDIVINLLKRGKDNTVENIYVSKFSSNKNFSSNSKKSVDNETWKELLPQIEKLVDTSKFNNKQEVASAAKLLLENELPITEQNISEITDIKHLQTDGIDVDKLLQEATKNLKDDRPIADIDLSKILKETVKEEAPLNVSSKDNKQLSKEAEVDIKQDDKNISKKNIIEYDIKKQQYEQIVKEIQQYSDDVIKKVLDNGGELTLKNLHMALEQLKQSDKSEESVRETLNTENSSLTKEQKKELKDSIEKELKTVTAKRQLAEIQLRLTSDAISILMQKGIDIDTMPLKDVVTQLKSIEKDLYKTQLEIAGAETSDENIKEMKDLYDKLSNITDLKSSTYQEVIRKDIPFTITALSDAEQINDQLLQLQQASETYENLQTQPNPKFKESFSKVSDQIEPLLNNLNIELTEANIRAAKILVKNNMEVSQENILDIKLVDTKVTEVTTQLHPTMAANMIRDGLKPADMHVDDVIKYMNRFEDLLGEDLTQKISSYIYEMDKSGELTEPERETMIGVYRMLYSIDKTQGRATGFVVKNNMDLTLNNLMEASNYYDRTNARYSDIDVRINDDFGAIEKVIVNEKSIKSQLNKAYENSENNNDKKVFNENNQMSKAVSSKEIKLNTDNNFENKTTKDFVQSISLNDVIKLVKTNNNIFDMPINELKDLVKENTKKPIDSKPVDNKPIDSKPVDNKPVDNKPIDNKPVDNKPIDNKPIDNKPIYEPLSKLDVDSVIETTNNIKTLTLKNKEDIFKVYSVIRNLKNIINDNANVNSDENTLNSVNKYIETSKNENIISNINLKDIDNKLTLNSRKDTAISNLINKISVADIAKFSRTRKGTEDISIKELSDYVNNTKIQSNSKDIPISTMSKEEVINQIDKETTLSQQTKELIKDMHKAVQTINSVNSKTVNEISKDNKIVTVSDLLSQIKNLDISKVVDELIQETDINTLAKLSTQLNNIDTMPIDSILDHVKENKEISVESDLKPLVQNTTEELLNYINKTDTNESQKNTVMKIYNIFNTLQNSDNKFLIEIEDTSNLTINTLSDLVSSFRASKQVDRLIDKDNSSNQIKNAINNLVQNITLDDIKNIETKKIDIYNLPIDKIPMHINKSQQKPLIQTSTDELLDYISKDNTLSLEQKKDIVKIYDITNTISDSDNKAIEVDNIELKTIGDLDKAISNFKQSKQEIKLQQQKENTVNNFISNTELNKLSTLIKKYPDIETIPLTKLVEDMKIELPKDNAKEQPVIAQVDKQTIIDYINKLDLNVQQKETAIKICDSIKNLASTNLSNMEIPVKANEEVTIDTIQKADKIHQTKAKLNEIINKTDLDKLVTLIKKYPNIENIPISKLEEDIKLQNSEPENTLDKLNLDRVFDYINKTKTLTSKDKDIILKVYTTIKDISNTAMKSINSIVKDEVTLIDLKESVNQYIKDNDLKLIDLQNKNVFDKFIQNTSPEKLLQLTKSYPNIESIPVRKLVEAQNIISEDKNKSDSSNIDDISNYIKSIDLTQKDKDTIVQLYNTINKIKDTKDRIKISDIDFTIDDLINQTQQEKVSDENIKPSKNNTNKSNEFKSTLEKFVQQADSKTITALVEQYPQLKSFGMDKVVDYMDKIKNSRSNEGSTNISTKMIRNIIQTKSIFSEDIDKIISVVDKVKGLDLNSIATDIIKQSENLTLDKFIESIENMDKINDNKGNISKDTQSSNVEQLNNYDSKKEEYDRTLLIKFIQNAEPEIISKVIKQYSNIENIPIENLLKSMELVQVNRVSNTKTGDMNDDSQKIKEFLESLSKISKTEPSTMLWMQKQSIPLTINNIDIVQNFIKNPFWFGEQLNNLSKDLKNKLGEQKDISKSVAKKDLTALKDGKTATELLEDLEEEIVKTKKEIIKLPEQERQSLWKQSSNLEKAIEIQKQIQKDELLYQIPMQLHNGLTNMNLYVMNDRQGNGKSANDEMKVFLAMDTATLGTVQIYMRMTEKSVSFQINSDNPEATKFLKNQQIALQSSIEDLGYLVNKIQYGQEQRKSPLQSQIQNQIRLTGKNTSDKGFETII